MPAKKKITRSAIIQTAVSILRNEGLEHVNTRNIAHELNCSTQPIYSEFSNMDELKVELRKEAERYYVETVKQYTKNSKYTVYMSYGLGFIRFAKDEKKMFQYLYMCDRHGEKQTIEDINSPKIQQLLSDTYGFPEELALRLHHDMMIYTYGLAAMLNTNYMDMSEVQIMERLRAEYVALCSSYRLPDILIQNKTEQAPETAAET